MAKKLGLPVIGDIELFLQENNKPVIAITGSNGKSTVTSLVGHMCQKAGINSLVAGNIGNPALDALTNKQKYDVVLNHRNSYDIVSPQRNS